MPRSGVNGTYTLPPNTDNQQPLTPISSSMFNAAMDDVEQTFNSVQPVAYGGTGASDAAGARASLGAGDFVGPNGGVADGQLVAFAGSTGKVGKLATMPAATVKGRASNAGTGAVSDMSVLYLGIFTPPGFATSDLTPLGVFTLIGTTFGFYRFAGPTGDHIQMPPGFPQTTGVIEGYLNSNNNYGYAWQKFTGHSNNRIWMRRALNATTWGPWQEIYHQGSILGTVSQSSGVPTGAIIERGSSANGEYVRFADGTLICTHSLASGTINIAQGSLFTSSSLTWSFPSVFAVPPRVLNSAFRTSGGGVVFGSQAGTVVTTSGADQIYPTGAVSGATSTVVLLAVGRWF